MLHFDKWRKNFTDGGIDEMIQEADKLKKEICPGRYKGKPEITNARAMEHETIYE